MPSFVFDFNCGLFSPLTLKLSNLISLNDLNLLTNFPTRNNNYLDLAFSSIPNLKCFLIPPFFKSDHNTFCVLLQTTIPRVSNEWAATSKCLNYKKCNINLLKQTLSNINWFDLL